MFGFPLLLIPLAICNIIVFLMPGVSFAAPLVTVPLMSGVAWTVTLSDALLAFGVLMLMFEVIKGARPHGKYFTDHFLALLVFAGAATEFVLLPQFGNSTFFLLTLLALVDFLSGIALRTPPSTLRSRRNARARGAYAGCGARAGPDPGRCLCHKPRADIFDAARPCAARGAGIRHSAAAARSDRIGFTGPCRADRAGRGHGGNRT